jgi:hypothetical protein
MPSIRPSGEQTSTSETPFDSIESAHEYVSLLSAQVEYVKATLAEDIASAVIQRAGRRLDALYLVDYKLNQLKEHLSAGGRILNDLRALRRLLLSERESEATPVAAQVEMTRRIL